jgi:hypothetical protein
LLGHLQLGAAFARVACAIEQQEILEVLFVEFRQLAGARLEDAVEIFELRLLWRVALKLKGERAEDGAVVLAEVGAFAVQRRRRNAVGQFV